MKRMILPIFKKYKKLLFSIMIVSAMGCAFMTGLSSSYVSLYDSVYDYMDGYSYPDAVITTDVTHRKNLEKLKALPSLSEMNARLCGDTDLIIPEGRYLSVRVFSYNHDDREKFCFWSQCDAGGKDSLYLEYNFAEDNGIRAGDTIKVKVGKDYRDYFVSGLVTCPETFSIQPSDNSWGVNMDFGYAYASVDLLSKEEVRDYDEAKSELDSEWEKVRKELDSAETKLSDAKNQLAGNKLLFQLAFEESEEKLELLLDSEKELNEKRSGLEKRETELSEEKKAIEALPEKTPEDQEKLSRINECIRETEEELLSVDDGLRQIADGRNQLLEKIEDIKSQLSDAEEKITESEKKFIDERTKALSEFEDLEAEIEMAYGQLEEGEGFEMLCNQFLAYFEDGADIDSELSKICNILEDEKIDVKSSISFEKSSAKKRIEENLKTVETLSVVMPVIFFAIILIVVFMFMSLIIKQSRREIGILRALGFSKTSIKLLFCGVNLIVSLFSVILGVLIGWLVLLYVGNYYKDFFPLPEFIYRFDWVMFLSSVVLTIAAGQLSTLISTGVISGIQPSEAMSRPAPETADIPMLLQRLTAKASPLSKFSVATLVRNKMRFVFSVICISSSVMMIFSALAFLSSKNYLLNQLYSERIHYDCQVFLKAEPDEAFMEELEALGVARDIEKVPFYQEDIVFGDKSEKGIINSIDPSTEQIGVYDQQHNRLFVKDDEIILERHLAQALGTGKDDIVSVNGTDLKISDISDQSVSRFQYIPLSDSGRLGEPAVYSLICDIDEKDEQKLLAFLTEDDNYLYVVFTRIAYKGIERIFKTYDLAAWIIIGFAVIIGLVIVINTAQTNLLEKKRELCVLRSLGFQHSEISRKWFVQSFLQFVFSCILGLPMGIAISKFMLELLSTADREYVFANSITEYLITLLLVFAYVVVSHLIAMHSMKKWDIVENVKDKE